MASNLESIRRQREALEKQKPVNKVNKKEVKAFVNTAENSRPIVCDIQFFNVEQLVQMTGWSRKTILDMFNSDPDFKGRNNGRSWIIEAHALIEYFMMGSSAEKEAV